MSELPINVNMTLDGTKVYNESIKPVTQPTAETLGLLPRAIKAAFAPLEKWTLHREYSVEETKTLLQEKLKNVSPDNIVPPEPYVAVPAIEGISYCMDSEELRNLYANLLARSINTETKNNVHPSFPDIIKQLSPIEAKILKHISFNHGILPICRICKKPTTCSADSPSKRDILSGENFLKEDDDTGIILLRNYSYKKFDNETPEMFSSCLENLNRLGLFDISYSRWIDEDDFYVPFLFDQYLLNMINASQNTDDCPPSITVVIKGACQITDLGGLFVEICVQD